METAITKGIKVSVETFYQEKQSAQTGQFVFAYRITIENGSNNTIQLLRRHWHIYDIHKSWREVEGEGVIGEQPILRPSEQH
ncbi:MAG: ApaG domain, partial [Chitinophagales bacterium]